jgi:hypothetical protein
MPSTGGAADDIFQYRQVPEKSGKTAGVLFRCYQASPFLTPEGEV